MLDLPVAGGDVISTPGTSATGGSFSGWLFGSVFWTICVWRASKTRILIFLYLN